ncbi:Transcription initiation factor IIA subunit 1 [Tripterygium wilfordii]|uniref:Transcription initiation factor IIA subunit 1 n=1 Tax=Tripterygium wilfordii TaxID=458696 RepID=A0A7J7DDY7_TRIWF|nr:Transcription initiation factor IIA subunit 1 [Tripterygium wilfordii]
MATSTTSSVYLQVIEDVINKVRDEFVNNGGPGEGVLNELQGIWEMKMMQAGVICGLSDRSSAPKATPGGPITPVHDLNVPYEGTEEYETPTAEILFPPTPAQTPIQTSLPGSENSSMYNIPTGPSEYSTPTNGSVGNNELKAGRPSPYMQPPSPWMNQRAPLDVNVAYVEGRDEVDRGASHQPPTQDFFMMSSGKRKREDFPRQYQNDKSFIWIFDSFNGDFQISLGDSSHSSCDTDTTASKEILAHLARSSTKIPQLDGPIPDPYDDVLSTPNVQLQAGTPAPIAQNDTGDDEEDEPLNENDDDELDDLDQGEELNTQHLVLAQFDKVTRTKSRWKCTLKDGIMHINNKDILFNKATGEFDF